MRYFLLGLIVLFFWGALFTYIYVCKVKKLCGERAVTEQVEEIQPEDLKSGYRSIFNAEDDLNIKHSQAAPVVGDQFRSSCDTIVDFLKKYPDTDLSLVGYHSSDETNPSDEHENIGLARAEAIKAIIAEQGIDPDRINVETKVNDDLFDENGDATGKGAVDFKFSERYAELNETDIKNAYNSIFELERGLTFDKNAEEVEIENEKQDANLNQLVYYLNRNKDQELVIDVAYTENEEDAHGGFDKGLLRARDLKQELMKRGIPADKIVISSTSKDDIFDEEGKSQGSVVDFNFELPDKTQEDKVREQALERALEKGLTDATSLDDIEKSKTDINFGYGSAQIPTTPSVREYTAKLAQFLSDHPDKKVVITGHTCSISSESFNHQLGLKRANACKRMLVQNGIAADKISTKSRGELSPAYSNDDESGRSKNRRVEIDIQ